MTNKSQRPPRGSFRATEATGEPEAATDVAAADPPKSDPPAEAATARDSDPPPPPMGGPSRPTTPAGGPYQIGTFLIALLTAVLGVPAAFHSCNSLSDRLA